MAIRKDWRVASTTARNALGVTDGNVREGDEAQDLSTGFIYRLVRAVTGSDSSWSLVSPIAFGTWTGTCTSELNLDATPTASAGGYHIRVGSAVLCWSEVVIDPTAAAVIQFRITPPVPSAFSATSQGLGSIISNAVTLSRGWTDATNDALHFEGTASVATSFTIRIFAFYQVL
jgi:hypothetical protein